MVNLAVMFWHLLSNISLQYICLLLFQLLNQEWFVFIFFFVKYKVLSPLDFSAVFNTIDHEINLNRHQAWVGMGGTTLQRFSS